MARYPAVTVSTYQMLTGAVILAPFAAAEMWHTGWRPAWDAASLPAYLSVLYLVLFCTVLAYTVWFLLLDRHSASDLSVFLFVQPVVGALLGVVFRHDPLTRATLAGAASSCSASPSSTAVLPDPTYLPPACIAASPVELVHGLLDAVLSHDFQGGDGALRRLVRLGLFAAVELPQHEVNLHGRVAGGADADAQAGELLGVQVLDQRLQAVVPARRAARPQPQRGRAAARCRR